MSLLMMWTVAMVSSKATPRLGRTRGTSGLGQCGCIEMMYIVDPEAKKKVCTLLAAIVELSPIRTVELLFIRS
jgi:hypothetical protein